MNTQPTALDAYPARAAAIHIKLAQLQQLADDHFGHNPEAIHWGHAGDLGEGLHHSTVNELLRLTLLEPAIIRTILAGQQPRCMSLLWFLHHPLPQGWKAQREALAGFDA